MRLIIAILLLCFGSVGTIYLTGKQQDAALNISSAALGAALGYLLGHNFYFPKGFRWQTFLASTLYRWKYIRISVSYLISINIDGKFLLVRGHRIRNQFQPVGGVFKVRQDIWDQLAHKFRIEPDPRFLTDSDNANDLRLKIKGKYLPGFLDWFSEMKNIETAPWREFFEELVESRILSSNNFSYGQFERRNERCYDGIRYDHYSRMSQLIVAEIYDFFPNADQEVELRKLLNISNNVESGEILFADHSQISGENARQESHVNFEISPTTRWLTRT